MAEKRKGGDPPKKYRWKKGQSGNPKGMKKGTKCLTDQIRKMLEKHISNYDPIEKKEIIKSIKDHLVAVLISKALSGEDRAITEILDRVEGKAVQSINAEINIDMADKRKKFEDMFSGINDN